MKAPLADWLGVLILGAIACLGICASETRPPPSAEAWQRRLALSKDWVEEVPQYFSAHNELAWALAICPIDELRDEPLALKHALRACELSEWKNSHTLDTLAAVYAGIGDFEQAVDCQQRAIALHSGRDAWHRGYFLIMRYRLDLYRHHQPWPVKYLPGG